MKRVYVGLGTNLGSRARNLSAARRRLREAGLRIVRQSRVIETEPWGISDQPKFLNQVVEGEWSGTPGDRVTGVPDHPFADPRIDPVARSEAE